ncbi:MAG TPA: isoprenylcysteine carboxylmethyltransferase family protein [Anaerolineales bacterium]|nr:isoprenylcysteine carboxylmethyltransferase family protein [Anaerolineales bacterium]
MNRKAILFLLAIVPALAILLALIGMETLGTNLLGWFLLMTGIICAAGIVIVAYIRRETFWESQINGDTVQSERGDLSFWMTTFAMMAVFYLSPLEYMYVTEQLPRTSLMEFVGVALVVLGIVLFVWARRTLGENYSGHLSTKHGQQLIQDGPYRIIRHPAYAGFLLMLVGLALGYSSLAGIAAFLFALLPSMIYRIWIEEKLLAKHFGTQFYKYADKTKRLIPGIW